VVFPSSNDGTHRSIAIDQATTAPNRVSPQLDAADTPQEDARPGTRTASHRQVAGVPSHCAEAIAAMWSFAQPPEG
jgi:hypothetical protein